MNDAKNIIFFLFIILMIVALLLNIILLKSGTNIKIDFLAKIDAIYFNEKDLNPEVLNELKIFLKSNQISMFTRIIEDNNPVFKFYGFCGLLNSNQKLAIRYLEKLLLNQNPVKIVNNNKEENNTLSFAILLLIKSFPEWLTNKPIASFYNDSANIIYNVYKSDFTSSDPSYKNAILSLINEKYPDVAEVIKKEITVYDDISTLSMEEKINISTNISNLPDDKKEKIVLDLLKENNPVIILNTIKNIDENFKNFSIGEELYKIITKNITIDITIEGIKKFSLLRKNNSVLPIQAYMKTTRNEKILSECLNQIAKYGNKETSYEFLKLYLATPYTPELNLLALKTIIATTYKEDPVNVMRTLMFIINKGEILPAIYAIEFHITNNIGYNNQPILARLSRFENDEMKKLTIKYIEYFNVKEGIPLVEQLTNDPNEEISNKAKDLLLKLK